jgi:hypothetical protein
VEHLFVLYFIRVGSAITGKYQTRPEKTDTDKQRSLLYRSVGGKEKKVLQH